MVQKQLYNCALATIGQREHEQRWLFTLNNKCHRELLKLAHAEDLRKDVDHLKVGADMFKFDVTCDDALANIVIVHLDVLSPAMEDRIPS